MNYRTITLTSLLLSTPILAFEDYDIDGVEDSKDLCPDTPFDVLVNKDGCPKSGEKSQPNNYFGRLTLKVGTDISQDESYEDDSSLNLYANYRYRNWDISISNSRSTTNSSDSKDNSYSDDDIYLSTGYLFNLPSSKLKLSIGSKIVNDDSDSTSSKQRRQGRFGNQSARRNKSISSRDNDYFSSVNFTYLLNPKQDIFLYYGYTLSGDSKDMDYEDYSSFSMGTGYFLNNSYYTALSYNYTGSIYPNSDAQQSISWFNSYKFTKNIFATASYRYALDDLSYDHTFSLGLGISFQ